MADKDPQKDQMGTYSSEVGEWTTGSGGGAGSEQTSIRPIGSEQNKSGDTDENTEAEEADENDRQ